MINFKSNQSISFFVILFFLIPLCISAQQEITLEGLWKDYEYVANSVPGFRFMNDGKHYTRLEDNTIKKYDLTSGNFIEDILSGAALKDQEGFNGKISNYSFHDDESKIIIASETESIYRRSSKSFYHIYDRSTKVLQAVYNDDKVQYATLSPDASHIAYVWENNIYYMNLESGETNPVTTDGAYNEIINGSADWVYEEEFSFAKAFQWSPDSKKIAFLRFDEREVPEFTMTNYKNELYPEYVTFKYPKVGEKNADVTVHVYNLKKDESKLVQIRDTEEFYIPRIKWTEDNNSLSIIKLNRHQNNLKLLLADANSGSVKTLLEEENQYYIDVTDDLTFLEDGKHFIWSSEKSGYNHLYLYDLKGNEKNVLTQGNYDVTNFYGVDEKNKKVYYRAAAKNAMEKEVYVVDLDGKNKKMVAGKSGMNSAQFSSTFDYYVNNHSNINSPPSYTVYDRSGKAVRNIEDNANLNQLMDGVGLSKAEFFDFKTKHDVSLNGYMIKPPNFNAQEKYPVFMYLYGGPGSQSVTDSWKGQNYWWFQMLAQKGYVVACVDNRGTGGRGEEFKKMTYMKLGELETIDQIEAAKYLGSLPFTDASRIGIFGWSYGGYMSSLCLLKGNDVFKAAIAVAPVTSWKWYDTVYTERYMRTHKENESGYEENSPVNFAKNLNGNYLLVHGMGDDNVHFQNSVEMANALIAANKQFDTYYYPNRNHGIYGGVTRLHLYTKMTDFILEKL
jgi:dipeptidyl-peptidase-4